MTEIAPATLLLEIGCEELPSSACREALEQVPTLFAAALAGAGIAGEHPAQVWISPRRIALSATVPGGIAPTTRRHRGPAADAAFDAVGAPTKAAAGFARGKGVAVEELVVEEDGGRRFVFALERLPGRAIDELVPDIARAIIGGLRFSKNMRWGDGRGLRFSRPVRWLVAKVDERTVAFEAFGLTAGDRTRGHRFLGAPATVAHARDYRDTLAGVAVVVDQNERERRIRADLDAAAAEAGGRWADPAGKLREVLFLVESPSVITGAIDAEQMRLPARVLVTAMQSHQRYFPLYDADGELMPRFLAVSNGDPAHAATITRGNEGVLNARLQDAIFSFDKDRALGLAALGARLDSIVFHQRLGTLADRRARLISTVADLVAALGVDAPTAAHAARAAELAKADQGAVLVDEFSDLQGYVAGEYARLEGEDPAVAVAIGEQYLPEGADSPLPSGPVGALVALADKLDALVGAFAVDEAPTGSKDPYGLRRAALGVVRILLDRGWDVDHAPLLRAAHARLDAQGADLALDGEATSAGLDAFLADRLAHILAGEGVAGDVVGAAAGPGLGGLVATATWARALGEVREDEALRDVWTAATRLGRIARKGSGTDVASAPGDDPGEAALREAIDAAAPAIATARDARDLP
ncbi:MAG TPA: glycine--tRNA ligase subunit beta, partial [Miltoncostaeaceae bacterium]|nr:glycine--tRNA ligase subunit beta [Miltoncostaeaceae bacterium]